MKRRIINKNEGVDIINYYEDIKNKLIDTEIYAKVKDYYKERYRVITYYEVGKMLYEVGSEYGEDIIGKYAEKLKIEVGKKYNKRTLFRMRQFFLIFSNKKMSTVSTLLSWSHYTELLSLKNYDEIIYYIDVSRRQNLSIRKLREKIKSKEYERLPDSTKNKLTNKEEFEIEDYIKNPIVIKSKNNYLEVSEKILHRIILEDIENFMKELGNNLSFIGSEYKIKIGSRNYFIDLLFFNIEFNSYVVVELKVRELKKEDIGQIEVYMNYIDKNIKKGIHNDTIGIILVKRNNELIMEYSSDERVKVREYILTI